MAVHESLLSGTTTVYRSLNHGRILFCYSRFSGKEWYKDFGFERGMGFLFFLDNVNEIKFLTCIRKCFDILIRDCL